METLKNRIVKLLDTLNERVYGKEEVMALALLSAVAGESIFLLGPPGVAKSMVARRLKLMFRGGKRRHLRAHDRRLSAHRHRRLPG